MRRICEHLRPRRGQSVVEFAIISIVIMLIIFGTIDLGRAVYVRSTFTNAVREGARYGMVNLSQASNSSTFQQGIYNAAAARSPVLGLTTANFPTSGITCAQTSEGYTTFSSAGCSGFSGTALAPGDSLKVCGTYTFMLAAARLIPIGPIVMNECAQVTFQ